MGLFSAVSPGKKLGEVGVPLPMLRTMASSYLPYGVMMSVDTAFTVSSVGVLSGWTASTALSVTELELVAASLFVSGTELVVASLLVSVLELVAASLLVSVLELVLVLPLLTGGLLVA